MSRRWFWLSGVVLLSAATSAVGSSGAWFHGETESYVSARVPRVSQWLHLHSQGAGESGYATQVDNPSLAAGGEDENLTVTFVISGSGTYIHNRVCKVMTPVAFPDVSPDPPVATVNVTVAITPDPANGQQPISRYGIDAWGAAPTYTKTINGWGANVTRQLNLQTKFPGKKFGPGVYTPSVIITVTYAGMTAAFYQYSIPVTIHYM